MKTPERANGRFPSFSYRGLFSAVPLKVKLYVGFGALIALVVALAASAYSGIQEMRVSERALADEILVNLTDLPSLRANINAERLDLAMLLEADSSDWETWVENLRNRTENDYAIINRLILRLRSDPYESAKLGEFIDLRDQYQAERDRQLSWIMEQNMKEEARRAFLGIQETRYQKMRAILHELETNETAQAKSMVAANEETIDSRISMFAGFGIGILVLSVFLASLMSRSISSYISRMELEETALSRANRSLKMILACHKAVLKATNESELLKNVCHSIVEIGQYKLAWVGYSQCDGAKSVKPMAYAGQDGEYVGRTEISWDETERGLGPTGIAIRTGKPVVARDLRTEPGFEPWRFHAQEEGFLSSATFPLKNEERTYGALMVYSDKPNAFDGEEVQLLEEFAGFMSYATIPLRGGTSQNQDDLDP